MSLKLDWIWRSADNLSFWLHLPTCLRQSLVVVLTTALCCKCQACWLSFSGVLVPVPHFSVGVLDCKYALLCLAWCWFWGSDSGTLLTELSLKPKTFHFTYTACKHRVERKGGRRNRFVWLSVLTHTQTQTHTCLCICFCCCCLFWWSSYAELPRLTCDSWVQAVFLLHPPEYFQLHTCAILLSLNFLI